MARQLGVSILGSTGSIGQNTLRVIQAYPERFRVVGLCARNSAETLAEQVQAFHPDVVGLSDATAAPLFTERVEENPSTLVVGNDALEAVATCSDADIVVVATTGSAPVRALLRAIELGRHIALANKESMVMAGHIVMENARRYGATIIPVDSEPNAIYQCLAGKQRDSLRTIWLTGSGGPFRTWTQDALTCVTPEQALRHPKWRMGRKITIDSATLMNKGLETIELRWLFDADPSQIQLVIHPEALVHSMVEFVDGSVLAHLANPDMRLPIQYALSYPDVLPSEVARMDFHTLGALHFEAPDPQRFPCLQLAWEAIRRGGTDPSVLNAANEVCVWAFLDGRMAFTDIPTTIEQVLTEHRWLERPTLDELFEADAWARDAVAQSIGLSSPQVA